MMATNRRGSREPSKMLWPGADGTYATSACQASEQGMRFAPNVRCARAVSNKPASMLSQSGRRGDAGGFELSPGLR